MLFRTVVTMFIQVNVRLEYFFYYMFSSKTDEAIAEQETIPCRVLITFTLPKVPNPLELLVTPVRKSVYFPTTPFLSAVA